MIVFSSSSTSSASSGFLPKVRARSSAWRTSPLAKFVLIRDVENQFLFSGAVQYEAPTGYSNIFQGHGDGQLAVYGIVGKQFWDNWHFVSTFGQNIALNNSNSGYFMLTGHIDRRFGKFVPFYEANWFYYNQSGRTRREWGSRAAAG